MTAAIGVLTVLAFAVLCLYTHDRVATPSRAQQQRQRLIARIPTLERELGMAPTEDWARPRCGKIDENTGRPLIDGVPVDPWPVPCMRPVGHPDNHESTVHTGGSVIRSSWPDGG